MYVDIGGEVVNLVIFQFSFRMDAMISEISGETTVLSSMGSSESTDMLLKLTVSARDIIVMEYVAFRRGSSQQGKVRRAAVGFEGRQINNPNREIMMFDRVRTSN